MSTLDRNTGDTDENDVGDESHDPNIDELNSEFTRAITSLLSHRTDLRLRAAAEIQAIASHLKSEFAAHDSLFPDSWDENSLRFWERVPTPGHAKLLRPSQLKGLLYRASASRGAMRRLFELADAAGLPNAETMAQAEPLRTQIRLLRTLRAEIKTVTEVIDSMRVDAPESSASGFVQSQFETSADAPPTQMSEAGAPRSLPDTSWNGRISTVAAAPAFLSMASRSLLTRAPAVLAPTIGLLFAISIVLGILQYSAASTERILREEISAEGATRIANGAILLGRDADRATQSPSELDLEGPELIDAVARTLDAPPQASGRHAATIPIPASGSYTGHLRMGFLADLRSNAVLMEGRWVQAARPGSIGAVMHGTGVDAAGLLVGDTFRMVVPAVPGRESETVDVTLTGRWAPSDVDSSFWYLDPEDELAAILMVDETDFRALFSGNRSDLVGQAMWYADFAPSTFQVESLDSQIQRLRGLSTPGGELPAGISVIASPLNSLVAAREGIGRLNSLLLLAGIPIFAAVLHYVLAAARLSAESRASELSTLRSRGAGATHILLLLAFEMLLTGSLITASAPFLGSLTARLIHRSHGFLIFGPRPEIDPPISALYFLIAGGIALAGAVVAAAATYGASHPSAVTYRASLSRQSEAPLWRKTYADLVLLALAMYLYWTLYQRDADSGITDPVLLLAPTALIVGLALTITRFLPRLIGLLNRLIRGRGPAPEELAAQHLNRRIGAGAAAFVLVVTTISIGLFLASAASTLDHNDELRVRFALGADVFLVEGAAPGYGMHLSEGLAPDFESAPGVQPPVFNLPLDLHENAEGVVTAARLWRGTGAIGGPSVDEVRVYGIDPDEFLRTVNWRSEYADRPLRELIGLLNDGPQVLVSPDLAAEANLNIGAPVLLRIRSAANGGEVPISEIPAVVGGIVRLFPTHQPGDGPFVVINDRVLTQSMGERPWDVLLRANGSWDLERGIESLNAEGLPVISGKDVETELQARRADPARIGLFGLLSVGFIGVLVLALALQIYQAALEYLRRRSQVGILRASGMTKMQLARWMAGEFTFLLVVGIAGGILAGSIGSWFGLQYLEPAAGGSGVGPDFEALIAWERAWQLAIMAGLAAVISLAVVFAAVARFRPHEAIQLAEEQF